MKERLLGTLKKGLAFVVSAPAGTGKTTLVRMLTEEFCSVVESISCTTRKPRAEEKDGKDYYFLSEEQFQKKVQNGEFLEHAEVFGHFYGTSKDHVRSLLECGKHVVLVIDTQGALNLQNQGFKATYIFVAPPSVEALENRLLKRKTEDEQTVKERLSWAHREMDASSFYDYLIVNDDLEVAYQILRSIVIAEEHHIKKEPI